MKKFWAALFLSSCAAGLLAQTGPVIVRPKVVNIFWGPTFASTSSPDSQYAQTLIAYRNQLGSTHEYNVLSEYCGSNGCVQWPVNLGGGTGDFFDTSTPPTNVSDTAVRSEVNKYLATHGAPDASTIYMVFIPSTSFSSNGSGTSCGGPSLAYCSYHNFFTSGAVQVKYTIQPYASCSGCQVAGWTPVQNQEHFVHHDVIDTVTDPLFTGIHDPSGFEVGDKCAWSPAPFFGTGGYGYQWTWSNQARACVKTR
jgi:hypothetical protein